MNYFKKLAQKIMATLVIREPEPPKKKSRRKKK